MKTESYTALTHQSDGISISVTITAPSDRPDVGELAELAQMSMSRAVALVRSNDATAQRIRERIETESRSEDVGPF